MPKEQKTEIKLLEEISEKLDNLLIAMVFKEQDKAKQIKILRKAGLKSPEIGKLLGLSDSTIRNY